MFYGIKDVTDSWHWIIYNIYYMGMWNRLDTTKLSFGCSIIDNVQRMRPLENRVQDPCIV